MLRGYRQCLPRFLALLAHAAPGSPRSSPKRSRVRHETLYRTGSDSHRRVGAWGSALGPVGPGVGWRGSCCGRAAAPPGLDRAAPDLRARPVSRLRPLAPALGGAGPVRHERPVSSERRGAGGRDCSRDLCVVLCGTPDESAVPLKASIGFRRLPGGSGHLGYVHAGPGADVRTRHAVRLRRAGRLVSGRWRAWSNSGRCGCAVTPGNGRLRLATGWNSIRRFCTGC